MTEKVNSSPERESLERQEQLSSVVVRDAGAASFRVVPAAVELGYGEHSEHWSKPASKWEQDNSHQEVVESLAQVLAHVALRAVRSRPGTDQHTGQAVASEHRDAGKNSDHGQG